MSSHRSGTSSTTPDGLIERCLPGDQSAWDTIVQLYGRRVFKLRDIHELSHQEIAERLRLPDGTVKSRINRGRIELARQIHQ